jgi:hypothetical protein
MKVRTRAAVLGAIGFAAGHLVGSPPVLAYGEPTDVSNVLAEIAPALPSANDDIELSISLDRYGVLCGRALTLAAVSPGDADVNLFTVSVVPGASCPAVVEWVTLKFRLGRLEAGPHNVLLWDELAGEVPQNLLTIEVAAVPSDRLFLQGGRFEVGVTWRDFAGREGVGHPVPGASRDSGLLSFFSPDNWELLVKILDGCALNGHYWILGSGATTVRFTLEVRDSVTGEVWRLDNPLGHPAGTFTDTAFAACH